MNTELRIKNTQNMLTGLVRRVFVIHNSRFILQKGRGFSLVEILVVVSITVLLGVSALVSFRSVSNTSALNTTLVDVISLYEEARSNTVASKDDSEYGVHATTTKFVLYKGAVYTEGAADNRELLLGNGVYVSGIALEDGGSDVLFERLTGRALSVGTTTLGLLGSSESISFVVDATGRIKGIE